VGEYIAHFILQKFACDFPADYKSDAGLMMIMGVHADRYGQGANSTLKSRNLRCVFIPHFDQISVKILVLGSYTLIVAPIGVKFRTEEGTKGPILRAKFHPHWCNVSPMRGANPQKQPLSKLNTGALRCVQ